MKIEDLKFPVNTLDNIIPSITIQEVIDTVYSNEAWKDEIRVKKVFYELLEANIIEAKRALQEHMKLILNELNK